MKKSIYLMGIASVMLVGCSLNEAKVNPDVPMVERPQPVITYEGSGNLVTGAIGEETQLNSTYSWSAKDNAIVININFDLTEYVDNGGWELGYFFLDLNSINDYLGILVTSETTEDNFYGVEPDGSKVDFGDSHAVWTSYKPGMWVNSDGTASNSGGMNYWQWYIWTGRDGIYYDYGEGTDKQYNGLFLVGGNPGNIASSAAELAGTTTTSRAKLIANGEEFDFIVNLHFEGRVPKSASGSGTLSYHNWTSDDEYEIVQTTSKYSWTAHEDEGIAISVDINTEEWQEIDDFEIGFIPDLTPDVVEAVFGIDPATLDDEHFYALDPDGTQVAWSSYAPGMWLNADASTSDRMNGVAYWQWYVRPEGSYDYDYDEFPGIVMVGGNPGNIAKITFDEPFTSKAVMVINDNEIPFTVTFTFHEVVLPDTEGYPEGVFEETGVTYPYGGGVDGHHTIQWYFDEEGLYVDVEASIPQIIDDDVWVFTAATIPTDVMMAYLGIDDLEKLVDITYFYPLNADGTPSGDWTTYAPGEWVDADGNATNWSGGHMYWWYNFGEHKYEGHFTEGLFLVGTNPGNMVAGETVVSKAQLGDKLLTVTVHFFDENPAEKAGKVGPFAYTWSLGDTAIDVTADVSIAAADDSWAWMGFFINENYINEKYGFDISALAADFESFYPVDASGTPLEKWTSYIPGMWFMEDGSAGAWDSGVSFWQYYTSNYAELGSHDFTTPGLFYVGKNPSYTFTAGTYVSRAKVQDIDFKFTLNIAE